VLAYLVTFLFKLFPLLQYTGPDPCPPGSPPDCDPGIPIVQFISILVSLGLWLGAKAFNKNKGNK